MSRPTISKAQTSYPIYAATFANSRPGYLVVGGGGGAGKHGVKNKITLLDFSSRAPTVEPSAELEVSEDDSVTCLANLATRNGLILYAGNGSSVEDRVQGKDMHFRSFEVQFPQGKAASSSSEKTSNISFLSKTQLLNVAKSENTRKEAYVRLLRLSPPRPSSGAPNKRIGAIASGLAGEENELVVFAATSNRPQAKDVINRVPLANKEANDIDIQDLGDSKFQLAYATDYEVHVHSIDYDFEKSKSKSGSDGKKVYTIPQVDIGVEGGRPKLRSTRWLSPKHLLLLANKPNRTGVELWLLHLYEEGPGSIVLKKSLPRAVGAATDLDVSLLDADSDGAYQIVIAVAGIDVSLSVYTMDYRGDDSLSHFHHYATYDNVHEQSITKVVFSPFLKPETTTGKPQYLRLASTSLGNSVSVETFTLTLHKSRHVLQTGRTRTLHSAATYLAIAMVVAAMALMLQSLVDPSGHVTNGLIPQSLRDAAGKTFGEGHRAKRHAAALNNADTPAIKFERRIRDLLHLHNPPMGSTHSVQEKAIVVHHDPDMDGDLSTDVLESHEDALKKHVEARRWDELSKEEQTAWKSKLTDAGMWAVGEGETILKSIFFGQIGGLVGQVAQGVLNG